MQAMMREEMRMVMCKVYHKGHGRLTSALPSDPIFFYLGWSSIRMRLNLINPKRKVYKGNHKALKTPKNPENGHFTLLNTCINWHAQKIDFLGSFQKAYLIEGRFFDVKLLKKSALILLEFWGLLRVLVK